MHQSTQSSRLLKIWRRSSTFTGILINRQEAKDDLHLKIATDLSPELETAIWDLYLDYEAEFENQKIFNPSSDLAAMPDPTQGPKTKKYMLVHAIIESAALSSRHTTERRYQVIQGPQPGQFGIQEDILSQGWNHSEEGEEENQPPRSSTETADVQRAEKG